MAVKRCVECGKTGTRAASMLVNGKECPYCEQWLCGECANKQEQVFSWNGCIKCCIDYRNLLAK
jgi:hypothetical protein